MTAAFDLYGADGSWICWVPCPLKRQPEVVQTYVQAIGEAVRWVGYNSHGLAVHDNVITPVT